MYTTENLFKDFEGKVPGKELEEVKGRIMELKELLKPEKKDAAAIKAKMDEVNGLVQKMSTELYQKAGQQYQKEHGKEGSSEGAEEPEPEEKHGKEKVVDADYEVKDEKKKKKK